jgi:hypothetical protein
VPFYGRKPKLTMTQTIKLRLSDIIFSKVNS